MKLAALLRLAVTALISAASFAQEPTSPAAATPAPSATAPLIEQPKKSRLELSIGDSPHFSDELKEKLTPEQLFELEMARVKSRNTWSDVEDIAVPIGFFVLIFAVIAVPAWLRFRQRRIMHETVRLMVEKGQPIPPELLVEKPVKRSDLRRGIVLCGLGAGLIVFFLCVARDVWGIGAIPFFLGLGHLVAWRVEKGNSAGSASS